MQILAQAIAGRAARPTTETSWSAQDAVHPAGGLVPDPLRAEHALPIRSSSRQDEASLSSDGATRSPCCPRSNEFSGTQYAPHPNRRLPHLVGGQEHDAPLLKHVLQPREVGSMHATPAKLEPSDRVGRETGRRAEIAQAQAQRRTRQPGLQRRDRE